MAKTKLPELPAGPKGAGKFGAYYMNLKWDPEWDAPWRIADHPDVVVRFDDGGHRFVFWHGTSFIPCWVTDTGKWYTNEFVERRGHQSPNTWGCCEPMSDKQCRFSHVRIIESNDARVVVHWRYAPVDVQYRQPFVDPDTNWGDWVDEYYTIYPDAVGVRKITVQTNRPDLWCEFHEAILINQPGTMPEENIELGALSVANMKGDSKTYVWTEDGAPSLRDFWELQDANIIKINLKATKRPFALVEPHDEPGLLITPYLGHAPTSHFNFWNHWPVSQVASDGTVAKSPDRPSHSSLGHFNLLEMCSATWKPYEAGEKLLTRIMLHGMTEKPVEDLVPLAKHWLYAPEPKVTAKGYESDGYDPTEKAYKFSRTAQSDGGALELSIPAKKEAPLINPAFVVRNWGERAATVSLNGKKLRAKKDYRVGLNHTMEGTDLVVWIKTEAKKAVKISISPA